MTLLHAVYETIRREGEKSYPCESCGVLLGRVQDGVREVREAVPCQNAHTDSLRSRYRIDERELIRIQRKARQARLDIVGFYHSHPDHPAQWSETDLAEAHWLGCSYVITAVEKRSARATNSFALVGSGEGDKRFEDEPIEIQTPGVESNAGFWHPKD